MSNVLEWMNWKSTSPVSGDLRGPCLIPACSPSNQRCLSVHLDKQIYHCFACGSHGNVLDLWASVHDVSVYRAAIALCTRSGCPIPYL